MSYNELIEALKSFPGHKGRPGQRGGSSPKGGGPSGKDYVDRAAEAYTKRYEREQHPAPTKSGSLMGSLRSAAANLAVTLGAKRVTPNGPAIYVRYGEGKTRSDAEKAATDNGFKKLKSPTGSKPEDSYYYKGKKRVMRITDDFTSLFDDADTVERYQMNIGNRQMR